MKSFFKLIIILTLPSALNARGTTLCCGINPHKYILNDISVNIQIPMLLPHLETILLKRKQPVNLIIAKQLDFGDDYDYNTKIALYLKRPTLLQLLKELHRQTGLKYAIETDAILIGTTIFKDKNTTSFPKAINNIIIPSIVLPPPIKKKTNDNIDWIYFVNYFKRLEALSKKYDKKRKGIIIQTIYKKGKDDFGDPLEDWRYNLYYRLPNINVKNISLAHLVSYICRSGNLRYEIEPPNIVKIYSYNEKQGKNKETPVLFTLSNKYLNKKNKLFAKVYTIDEKTKKKKLLDEDSYQLEINPDGFLACAPDSPINSFLKQGMNSGNIAIFKEGKKPPKSFQVQLEILDENGKTLKLVEHKVNFDLTFTAKQIKHYSCEFSFKFNVE